MRFLWLILLFCATSFSFECRFELLAGYPLADTYERKDEDKQKWFAHKNENKNPKKVDLSDPSSTDPAPDLADWEKYSERRFPSGYYPTEYGKKIMSLQKGDTVIFDGEEFLLGEFLGAGASTHIFALEKYPFLVIRLPFATPYVTSLSMNPDPDLVGRRVNWVSTRSLLNREHSPKTIIPDPKGLGRYSLVSRVRGNENGQDYIQRILPKGKSSSIDELVSGMGKAEGEKLKMLVRFMEDNRHLSPSSYLWDEVEMRWYLIDGEDEDAFTYGVPF